MEVAIAIYVMVGGLFVVPTLEEGVRKQLPWDGHRILGLVLSLAWPVLVAICAVLVLRDARTKRSER